MILKFRIQRTYVCNKLRLSESFITNILHTTSTSTVCELLQQWLKEAKDYVFSIFVFWFHFSSFLSYCISHVLCLCIVYSTQQHSTTHSFLLRTTRIHSLILPFFLSFVLFIIRWWCSRAVRVKCHQTGEEGKKLYLYISDCVCVCYKKKYPDINLIFREADCCSFSPITFSLPHRCSLYLLSPIHRKHFRLSVAKGNLRGKLYWPQPIRCFYFLFRIFMMRSVRDTVILSQSIKMVLPLPAVGLLIYDNFFMIVFS